MRIAIQVCLSKTGGSPTARDTNQAGQEWTPAPPLPTRADSSRRHLGDGICGTCSAPCHFLILASEA